MKNTVSLMFVLGLTIGITKCQGVEHYFLSAASVSLANSSANYTGSFGVSSMSVM